MTATSTQLTPRTSTLDRTVAMRLAATEYERVVDQWRTLTPDQWAAATDCPEWTVRDMAGHMLGMARLAASVFEQRRQQKLAEKIVAERHCVPIDALTSVQVEKEKHLGTAELVAAMSAVGRKAARSRRRAPGFIRRRRFPETQHINGVDEPWTVGYLIDTILTRDPWMHRVDIARATGADLVLTAEHDGVLVNDVVQEWAGRHGRPVHVTLTGPAGGIWSFGTNGGAPAAKGSAVDGGPSLELDAVEFCRHISGRSADAQGLLTTEVPF